MYFGFVLFSMLDYCFYALKYFADSLELIYLPFPNFRDLQAAMQIQEAHLGMFKQQVQQLVDDMHQNEGLMKQTLEDCKKIKVFLLFK